MVALAGAGAALPALRTLNACSVSPSGGSGVAKIASAWHKQLVHRNLGCNQTIGSGGAAALTLAGWPALRYLGAGLLWIVHFLVAGATRAGGRPPAAAGRATPGPDACIDEQSPSALAWAVPNLMALHELYLQLGRCTGRCRAAGAAYVAAS